MTIETTTEAERLADIRKYVDLGGLINNDDAKLLLEVLDRHKANLLAALDRVVELERERDAYRAKHDTQIQISRNLNFQLQQREADVREMVAAVDDWLIGSNGSVPLKVELAAINEALAKVRGWLKC